MNTAIKQQWVDALRSGTYAQVCGSLHDDEGFCVLGVLTDLHRQWIGGEWTKKNPRMRWYLYEGETGHLPTCVREWASVTIDDPVGRASLRNDGGFSFEELAQWIEENFSEQL